MIKRLPLRFRPYLKKVIWGGNKICEFKRIPAEGPGIGESWEISAVPGYESVVVEGPYKGMNIVQLAEKYGSELLGKDVFDRYGARFPLLIKFIDAADNLSVQVHPDDALAMKRHNSMGKTEMWYIVQADNKARIYSGLNKTITPEEYEDRVKKGDFHTLVAEHDSKEGDVFFLPAGRVHAIGGGNLLAEIQESSDITYRIFDYNRRDKDGNLRELHTELAKDAIDFNFHKDYKSPPLPENEPDFEIARCLHFNVRRLVINDHFGLNLDNRSFTVLTCVKGNVKISYEDGECSLSQGHSILLPASMGDVELSGKATLLVTRS